MSKSFIVVCWMIITFVFSMSAYGFGHGAGKNEGFEAGRYAEHEYLETNALAETCDEWVTIYNAKKPGNNEHVEKSCDAIRRTAQSYVGKTSDGSSHNGIVDNAGYTNGVKIAPVKSDGALRAAPNNDN